MLFRCKLSRLKHLAWSTLWLFGLKYIRIPCMGRINRVKYQKPAEFGRQNVLACHLALKLWQVRIFTPKMKVVTSYHPAGCVYFGVTLSEKPTEDVWMNCNVLKRIRAKTKKSAVLPSVSPSQHSDCSAVWLKSGLFCHRRDSKSSNCSSRWNGSPRGGMRSAADGSSGTISPITPASDKRCDVVERLKMIRRDLHVPDSWEGFNGAAAELPSLFLPSLSHGTDLVLFRLKNYTQRLIVFSLKKCWCVSGWHHPHQSNRFNQNKVYCQTVKGLLIKR